MDEHRRAAPTIPGDRPVDEALNHIAEYLENQDREAVIRHLARACWAGPLEPWLQQPDVSDLEIGAGGNILVRRTDRTIHDTGEVLNQEWIEFLVYLWRRNRGSEQVTDPLTASTTRLFRFTYVSGRHSVPRPSLSIRIRHKAWTLEDLQAAGAFNADVGDLLQRLALSGANVLVSGGSGAGKTAVQEAMLRAAPKEERIIVVTMECEFLLAEHPRALVWELSPDRPEVTLAELTVQALKSQPDRIVVGEVRGGEAATWLHAVNAGVWGGMVTVHANAPAEALDKILALARLGSNWPARELAKWLATARPVVVQVALDGNKRRVTAIGECQGFTEREGEVRFSVASLYDGSQIHYQSASDQLLASLPAKQWRK